MNQKELAYLKAYSDNYQYVARDKDGRLYAYITKPNKLIQYGCWMENKKFKVFNDKIFDFIKWEDEEPYKIKDLLGEEQ